MKWKNKAREIQRESKYDLDSLPGSWVIVRKFTINAQEKIMQLKNEIPVDEKGIPQELKEGELKRFHTAVLLEGVIDHNFENEAGQKEEWTETFLDELFQFPEIEGEIFNIVLEHNRPLAQKSNGTSETQQNGGSQETSSEKES
jgi:hypothetical protein